MSCCQDQELPSGVVPYVGTWIEIFDADPNARMLSVVPYVGTWIEIHSIQLPTHSLHVVPYVGTWIEIYVTVKETSFFVSFPTWERG